MLPTPRRNRNSGQGLLEGRQGEEEVLKWGFSKRTGPHFQEAGKEDKLPASGCQDTYTRSIHKRTLPPSLFQSPIKETKREAPPLSCHRSFSTGPWEAYSIHPHWGTYHLRARMEKFSPAKKIHGWKWTGTGDLEKAKPIPGRTRTEWSPNYYWLRHLASQGLNLPPVKWQKLPKSFTSPSHFGCISNTNVV